MYEFFFKVSNSWSFKSSKLEIQKVTKNKLKQNQKVQIWFKIKVKISEVFKFSILPYKLNRKLGNLGKFSVTSNFDISCNLRFKNGKKQTEAKT